MLQLLSVAISTPTKVEVNFRIRMAVKGKPAVRVPPC
jgi:hypothetical protein